MAVACSEPGPDGDASVDAGHDAETDAGVDAGSDAAQPMDAGADSGVPDSGTPTCPWSIEVPGVAGLFDDEVRDEICEHLLNADPDASAVVRDNCNLHLSYVPASAVISQGRFEREGEDDNVLVPLVYSLRVRVTVGALIGGASLPESSYDCDVRSESMSVDCAAPSPAFPPPELSAFEAVPFVPAAGLEPSHSAACAAIQTWTGWNDEPVGALSEFLNRCSQHSLSTVHVVTSSTSFERAEGTDSCPEPLATRQWTRLEPNWESAPPSASSPPFWACHTERGETDNDLRCAPDFDLSASEVMDEAYLRSGPGVLRWLPSGICDFQDIQSICHRTAPTLAEDWAPEIELVQDAAPPAGVRTFLDAEFARVMANPPVFPGAGEATIEVAPEVFRVRYLGRHAGWVGAYRPVWSGVRNGYEWVEVTMNLEPADP